MRKPAEFSAHPVTYTNARAMGMLRAVCKHVVDGDTFDVFIDLGLGKYAYDTIRLYDIDTPEINSGDEAERARGEAAKAQTAALILDKPLLLRTYKDAETFGRYVAETHFISDTGAWASLAETLKSAGFVK